MADHDPTSIDRPGGAGARPVPWWYFIAIGALGPALIVFGANAGLLRLLAALTMLAIVAGLLLDDHGRSTPRPRLRTRPGRQQWRYTVMILSVVVITQLIQRAGQQANPSIMAAASFVALAATTWWFTRRIEGDGDHDRVGEGTS